MGTCFFQKILLLEYICGLKIQIIQNHQDFQ